MSGSEATSITVTGLEGARAFVGNIETAAQASTIAADTVAAVREGSFSSDSPILAVDKLGLTGGTFDPTLDTPKLSDTEISATLPISPAVNDGAGGAVIQAPELGRQAAKTANTASEVAPVKPTNTGEAPAAQTAPVTEAAPAVEPAAEPAAFDEAAKAKLEELQGKGETLTAHERLEMNKLIELKNVGEARDNAALQEGKNVLEALRSNKTKNNDGTPFTEEQLNRADDYRKSNENQLIGTPAEAPLPPMPADKLTVIDQKRNAFVDAQKKGVLPDNDPDSLSGKRPHLVMTKAYEGKDMAPEEQNAYNKHVNAIEGKINEGKQLTVGEAKDYQEHLDREQSNAVENEASEIGSQLTTETLKDGKISPETQTRLDTFIDKLTGGKGLLKSIFDFSGLDPTSSDRVLAKVKDKLKSITPEISKKIKEKLDYLVQLECQLFNLRKQKAEMAQCAHDVRDFLTANKEKFKPVLEVDSTDDKALQNRIKWGQAIQMLNSYKAAIATAENSKLVLMQEYRSAKAYVEDKLGINPDGMLGRIWRYASSYGENKTIDMITEWEYAGIEGANRPIEGREKHKKLDLSGLLPA